MQERETRSKRFQSEGPKRGDLGKEKRITGQVRNSDAYLNERKSSIQGSEKKKKISGLKMQQRWTTRK